MSPFEPTCHVPSSDFQHTGNSPIADATIVLVAVTGVRTVAEGRGRAPAGTFAALLTGVVERTLAAVERDRIVPGLRVEREHEEEVVRA